MIKKIATLFLTFLILSLAAVTVCADLQIKGKTDLQPGDTTEYVISVSGCEKATAASVAIECGDGLLVQSGSFLKEGALKHFDAQKNKGAIGGLTTGDINGEFFKFTVQAANDANLSRNFTVTVTAKNGTKEVFNQSATLVKGSPVTPKTSSQTVTVESGAATTLSQEQKTDTASTQSTSATKSGTNGSQLNDSSPLLYIIVALISAALAVAIIILFRLKNKKSNPQD